MNGLPILRTGAGLSATFSVGVGLMGGDDLLTVHNVIDNRNCLS